MKGKGGLTMPDQDAEVFAEVLGKQEFIGELFFQEETKKLTVVTPEADYVFTLTEVIKK
jgi:hypothetical protein